MFPAADTRSASPRTEISFRGVAPGGLGAISVEGSRSGARTGSVRPHPDGNGASLVFATPFRAGERVTVRTDLDVAGAQAGDFSFTTVGRAREGLGSGSPPPRSLLRQYTAQRGQVPRGAVPRYRSRPDLRPPEIQVSTRTRAGVAEGSMFVSPKKVFGARKRPGLQSGPLILDNRAEPVWFAPLSDGNVSDFRVQSYRGRPVLTWWQGRQVLGSGEGIIQMVDSAYRSDPPGPRGQRLLLRLPRGGRHRAGHAARPRLQPGRPRPAVRRRPARRARGRRHRAGGGHRHRPRALRVAQPRQRRAAGELRPGAAQAPRAVRLLPRQRHRDRHRRQPARLGPRDVVGAQARPPHRRDDLAPGRQAQRLPPAALGPLRLAARRPAGARRDDPHLRQRGGAEGAFEVARPVAGARRSEPDRARGALGRAPRGAAGGDAGQRPGAAQRQHVRGLGLAGLLHRVRRRRPGAVRRARGPGQRHLPRLPLPVVGHARWPARAGRASAAAAGAPRYGRAGTGRRRSRAGRCWPATGATRSSPWPR